mgnify:FL=1
MFSAIFQRGAVLRTRRNHALEHATLQILARRNPHRSLAGYSDPGGFWVVGNTDPIELGEAIEEALKRLRGGERALAVHPHCGTNFAVSGLAAGAAAWLAMLGADGSFRRKLDRLPTAVTLATLALIAAQPLGPALQARVTTEADLGGLQATEINQYVRGQVVTHRVKTRGG